MDRELIIGASDQDQTLQRWLKKQFPNVPFSQWQKWLRTGQVRYDGKRAKGNEILVLGQKVRIPPFAAQFSEQEIPETPKGQLSYTPSQSELEAFKATIIFENDDFIVLNKPAGLAVQGGSTIKKHVDGLVRALYPDNPPKLVHRLDRETSGLLMLAKTHLMAQKLTKAFSHHIIQKEYWAVTEGIPLKLKGNLITQLEKGWDKDMEKMRVASATSDAKPSETSYQVIAKNNAKKKALLSLVPHTGRTHQLRVHSEYLGCPILGDRKYNPKTESRQLHLHAHQLTLPPEFGGYVFTADVPIYFYETMKLYKLAT
ncbi:RluA family pseudouridine synthase [Candidatus Bodocaedibacter vickermanii]|uniref:Ribosomal large subunit pseudouridine synthase C n=1 Tax=Candidatus Bodocaedibacter vickermanii TaxID=2741701 RepID=A0A7L9RUX5_9PROT|nr:Ribosomal large subunit pseudouridine synthase C [Candidatus Paracaedibacteraceae bacterium 'Lake Konstanz']